MEVSSEQQCTEWEQGSSVSCFYVLLSEDAVVFFSPVYTVFAIVQSFCTSIV